MLFTALYKVCRVVGLDPIKPNCSLSLPEMSGLIATPSKLWSSNNNTQPLTFLIEFLGGNSFSGVVLASLIMRSSFSFLIDLEPAQTLHPKDFITP
jgi:hypothetical protein